MLESLWMLFMTNWLIAVSIMLILWLYYLYSDEPAIVDIGWSCTIGICTGLTFLWFSSQSVRGVLLLFAVLFWSVRLASLLIIRMRKGQRDRRYSRLSSCWGEKRKWRYLLFFQVQALSIPLFLLPIFLSFLSGDAAWSWYDAAGACLYVIGILGEVFADRQMAHFRANPKNAKKVCMIGLWNYSRHPNYFFELMVWTSYAVVAMQFPIGLLGLISPIILLISILKVSGIPPTEESLLATKGEAYREYQRTRSALIPLPPGGGK